MAAKVVAVVNQKGGSGKTTLTMQLAGTLARRGVKVLVVDADTQGTATRWSSSAPDDTPFPAAVIGLSAAGNKVHRVVYPTTAANYFAPNPVKCPQLNPFWRGQGHGLTPFLLPTRSVSHPMALRHVASHVV